MGRIYVAALLAQLAPLGSTLQSFSIRLCSEPPRAVQSCRGPWRELEPALAPFSALRRLHIYAVHLLEDEELRTVGAALPSLRELGTWCAGDEKRGAVDPAARLARLQELIPSLEAAPISKIKENAYRDPDDVDY
eukprot:tig00000254_g22559.t1